MMPKRVILHYGIFVFGIMKIVLFILLLSVKVNAQPSLIADKARLEEQPNQVNKIKAAYLFNFLKYVDIQSEVSSTQKGERSVCVLGKDPFGVALDSLEGRIAKGAKVRVHRVSKVLEAKACNIVFISQSKQSQLKVILETLQPLSILTVSDIAGFADLGGVIGFINKNKKIKVRINLTNARNSNIRISALLLEIAELTE
jgi:hypothetical protein